MCVALCRIRQSVFISNRDDIYIDIGATDIEGVRKDCRYLAIVTLYPNYFFRKKFAE